MQEKSSTRSPPKPQEGNLRKIHYSHTRLKNAFQTHLRDYGCEAAVKVYVLMHLAAIGSQKPFPKSSLLAHGMVAMALISREPLEIPVVGRSRTHQCDEDGFSGHIELVWTTKNIRDAQLESKQCLLQSWIESVLKIFLFLYLSSTTMRCHV